MVISYFNDFNSFYLYPDITSILIFRYRVFVRLKNQPIWMVKITSPLPFPVFRQLVITTRKKPNILKGLCCGNIIKP